MFNGGVKEAIAEAKAKKTVFVVIVTGLRKFIKNQIDKKENNSGSSEDEATVKLDKVLDDQEIISRLIN